MFEERGLVCSLGVQFPLDTRFNDVLHYHPHEVVCPDDAYVHLLEEIAIAVQEAKQKHDLLILGMNEAVLSALRAHPRANALKNRQGRSVESLTEYALRPATRTWRRSWELVRFSPKRVNG
jgi:hypothetical protein